MTTRVRRSTAWERLWIQRARNRSPAATAAYLSDGRWVRARHLDYLDGILRDAIVKGNARIIIEWPPRHGKSHYLSKWTPVWFLNAYPDRNVILASNTATLAEKWGKEVRNAIEANPDRLEVRLSTDSKARGDWSTTAGGGMLTKGVGGTILGFGADLMIIDDPHEGQAEANSEVKRESVWDWWTGQARNRLEPGASVIVLHQRLHEEDFIGRLVAMDDSPWQVITLRAIAEEEDPLGRAEGEPLWPERFNVDALDALRRDIGSHAFEAQYQQRPFPAGGSVFQREHFRYFEVTDEAYLVTRPDGRRERIPKTQCWMAQTCDTALKVGTLNDWTVVVTFAAQRGFIGILDVQRVQLEVPDQWPFLRQQRAKWPHIICQAVEDRASGTGLLQLSAREGEPLHPLKPDGIDKVTRATPLAIHYEAGIVYHLASAAWLPEFEHELLAFPNGKHDDQVDAASYVAQLVQEIGFGSGGPIQFDGVTHDREDDDWFEPAQRDRFDGAYPF